VRPSREDFVKMPGVLYVGDLKTGGTCLQRMVAFADLGWSVQGINTVTPQALRRDSSFLTRVIRRLSRDALHITPAWDFAAANAQILEALGQGRFDILWIDKGTTIEAATLQAAKRLAPHTIVIGYSPDDMMAKHNVTRQFLQCLPFYDFYLTNKSYCIPELRSFGCPNVFFMGNAYDPHTHCPLALSEKEEQAYGGEVGFIGAWERQRAASIAHLVASGVPVRIWGEGWAGRIKWKPSLRLEDHWIFGSDYAMGICSFKVNLCFLRKANRDLQNHRSVEIPACGAFMLAERTDEHRGLFEEGKEAEFFGSDGELLEKTRFYLSHEDARKRIAAAGRQRCLNSGYSNLERLQCILAQMAKF